MQLCIYWSRINLTNWHGTEGRRTGSDSCPNPFDHFQGPALDHSESPLIKKVFPTIYQSTKWRLPYDPKTLGYSNSRYVTLKGTFLNQNQRQMKCKIRGIQEHNKHNLQVKVQVIPIFKSLIIFVHYINTKHCIRYIVGCYGDTTAHYNANPMKNIPEHHILSYWPHQTH